MVFVDSAECLVLQFVALLKNNREIKQRTFLIHGRLPEVKIQASD